ncbi:MAG: type II secretion system protein N [Pseudomonadota bacterium]
MRALVEVSALVVLGSLLGKSVWLVLAPAASVAAPTPPPNLPSLSMSATSAAPADKSILLRVNAFEEGSAVVAAPTLDDVPETSLNLKLKGQRAVTGEGLGTATIVTPDNRQGVYREGEEILDGVVLSRVLSDRVILEKDGRFESLFWDGRDGALNVLGSAYEPRQNVANQEVVEGSTYRIASLSTLLGAARIERATGPAGWRFRAVGDPSVLRSAGIFDGDYLMSIDGTSAESLNYESLSALLNNADRVNLSVRRGTQTLNLTLIFEERS